VHRHGNETFGEGRLVDLDMFDAARQQDRDPIALNDPFGLQSKAPPSNLLAERSPR